MLGFFAELGFILNVVRCVGLVVDVYDGARAPYRRDQRR